MHRLGFIHNQATSQDAASAASITWLLRDVLASVLLRLPASDLCRFRRVCKEWREVISDPAFIDEHIDHGPRDPTHTIVFFSRSSPAYRAKFPHNIRDFCTEKPRNGGGYLLDELWRVTAQLTVGESEDMVGACNGLLCFLDVLRDIIIIVEPFTSEHTTLPLPPETERWHDHSAYCFGFEPSSRRYKLLHLSRVSGQRLYMYTIGEDTNWRSMHITGASPSDSFGYPNIVEGSVYWTIRKKNQVTKLARFDLETEELTSELIEFRRDGDRTPAFYALRGLDRKLSIMTIGRSTVLRERDKLFIGEGAGRANSRTLRLPSSGQFLTWPQPLQRGHILLGDCGNGGMYAHPIAPASDDLGGSGNLVLRTDGCKGGTHSTPATTRGLFVPVTSDQGRRVPHKQINAKAFCYAPPLCPAPLARYFGKL